jgi:signal transduction histidine kinase
LIWTWGEVKAGKGFLEQLKGDISRHRVIVLTAHEDFLKATSADEFAVFRYLHKPEKRVMESLRFTVSQAFKDIEAEQLKDKNKLLNKIQQQINSSIQESTPAEDTQDALRNVLSLIAESVRDVVGAYTSHIRVYNLKKGDFHLAAFAGDNNSFREIFSSPKRKDESFSGTVAAHRQARHYSHLQSEPDFQEWKAKSLNRIEQVGDALLLANTQEYFETVESAFIAPITTRLFGDETDAVFSVSSDSVNFFSPNKQDIILEFVAQAATAITRAWQTQRKHELHSDYRGVSQVLGDMSRQLLGEDDKSRIYDTVINGISQIIKPEAIGIFLYNPTTGVLDNEAQFRGSTRFEPNSIGNSINEGLTGLVFSSGMPLRVPNLQTSERMKPWEHPQASMEKVGAYVEQFPSGRVDHYLAVPMIVGNERVGAIQLLNKKSAYYENQAIDKERWLLERGFSDDCENVLEIAANHLAVALRNADLLEQQRKQTTRLTILKDVGRFSRSGTSNESLARIITEAAKGVQAELCLLFLLDKDKVVLKERYGIPMEELPEASYDIGTGFTGQVLQTGKSILLEHNVPHDKYDQQILMHLRKLYGIEKQIESLMIVPIITHGQSIGVIKAINKRGKNPHYDQVDLKFFEDSAGYVGLAIENQKRYDDAVGKLAQENATLSNLVRAVVHEFNRMQPLIRLNINRIKKGLADSDFDIHPMIDAIDEVSSQTVTFVNSIRDFEPGRSKESRVLDINSIIQKAFRQLIPALEKQQLYERVELVFELSPDRLMCAVYETPFIQVVQNLLLNAYQSMAKTKTAHLRIASSVDHHQKFALVKFTDTGCGIKEEFLPRIFEHDFTTKQDGTGIGLWLTKWHLDNIDASISVSSAVNQGTTFEIAVPLSEN